MKIGILTQPLGLNYGGVLQNFALQQVLLRLGHQPLTLRIGKITLIQFFLSYIKAFITHSRLPESQKSIDSRKIGMESFIQKYIKSTSERVWYKREDVLENGLEALIVGSDQTWRPAYNWKIEDLYLNYVKDLHLRRISYAASFGTSKWEYTDKQTIKCKKLLWMFDYVSVREDSGIQLCKTYFERKDVLSVLDPTLLLNREDYAKVEESRVNSCPYIFAYILDNNQEKEKVIKLLGKGLDKDVIIKSVNENIISTDSVSIWLSMVRDADYIVTDSFHGTVFSILYHKKFIVIQNERRGGARIKNLLGKMNLRKALASYSEISYNSFNYSIDWDEVDTKLDKLREESISFLRSSLA